jgi:CBS-domain-containing membrane protein
MELQARDVMKTDVITVHQDMDLRDLAKLFLDKAITGVPVVDERGEMVGVVSQTDLIYYNLTRDDELVLPSDFYDRVRVEGRHLPPGYQIEDVNTGKVRDVMTPVVHSVAETASLQAVARMMTGRHIHRVIVRRGKRPTGIISALDLLRVLGRSAPARLRRAARSPRARRSARAVKAR